MAPAAELTLKGSTADASDPDTSCAIKTGHIYLLPTHEIAVLGVGCQYAVVTGEIGPGSGYESRQLSQKLQRFEDEMCGAVLEGVFEFINDASIRLGGQPIEG